jgi:hypothetical protein
MDPSDEKAFAENGFSVSEEDAGKAAAEAKAERTRSGKSRSTRTPNGKEDMFRKDSDIHIRWHTLPTTP